MDTVDRLYERLADVMQRTRRDAFTAPVTVAEIYQELVPYRLVRGDVGFDMNADYEHALLRLLSGEGDRARLEPAHAREEIARELRSPNPNVSIYREFAGCDVWVSQPERDLFHPADALRDVLDDEDHARGDDDEAEPDTEDSDWSRLQLLRDEADSGPDVGVFALADTDVADATPGDTSDTDAATPHTAADAGPATPAHVPDAAASGGNGSAPARGSDAAADAAARMCAYCDSEIMTRRPVRFCPFCGQDQTTRPCSACGEALEPGWQFCIACGASRAAT